MGGETGEAGRYPYVLGLRGARGGDKASRKMGGLNAVRRLALCRVIEGEEGGTRGVAVKCIDITKNPDGEGSLRAC